MLLLLDANAALLLAAFGALLICVEFCLPGWVIPGVAGGVCLICGIYRLSSLNASPVAFSFLGLAVLGVAASGYGFLPPWTCILFTFSVPWICRWLLPGAVAWSVALFAGMVPVTVFLLLRIAARAAANKTLLQ